MLERDLTQTDRGTDTFKAPEVESGHYTYKIDIWSAGVVLYYMLTGSVSLFRLGRHAAMTIFEKEPDCVAERVGNFLLPAIQFEDINGPCLQVLQSLLVYDPDKRKDWDEIICLEWLTEGKEERSVEIDGIAYKYYTKPLLGKGASCKVFKGVTTSTPEVTVAVKVFKEKYLRENRELFRGEMEILNRLREQQCEEFVKFFGQTEDDEGNHFVIFEYCNCTLASQIIGGVCETVAHDFMKQIGLFFIPLGMFSQVLFPNFCVVSNQSLESKRCMSLVMCIGTSNPSTSLSRKEVTVPGALFSVILALQSKR